MTQKTPFGNITSAFKANESFLILCVQVAVLHIGLGLIAPILPLYAQTFAVSITLVGFLLTSQSIPRIFINLPVGRWADRWGAHRTMTIAAGIVMISAVLGGLAPNYFIFLLTRLLQGVGTGMSQTSGFTYTATVSRPNTRARYISLYQGSFLLGSGIGPVIGGVTAEYFGYRAPFFVYAVLAGLVGIWMYLRLPDPRNVDAESQARRRERPGFLVSMRQMLSNRGVVLASLIGFVAAYNRVATRYMAIPLQGDALGFTEGQIGLALSLLFIMTFVALYFVGTLADRFGRKVVIVPSWLLTAAALIIIAVAPEYITYVAGAMFFGFVGGIGGPVPAAYIADAADEEAQGMAIGVFRTFSDFGLVIGPIVMGWLIDHASIAVGLYINATIISVVALAFWFFAPEPQAQQQAVGTS